jgi:hypothetical protein
MIVVTPAERILLGLGIRGPKDIDLEAIAWSLGAAVEYEPLDGCEALIVGSSRKAVILVNSESREERQRFLVAHEIGHWHHHRGKLLYCSGKDIGNPVNGPLNPERQADDFASDLILPNYMLIPLFTRMRRVVLSSAREISCEFAVSVTASLIRMVRSNCFPIMVVCHNKTGKRWGWAAPMVPGWWRLRPDLDRESFAHGMLYAGAPEEKFPRKIGADAWFDFRGCDRYEVEEQSFRVVREEIITILTIPSEGLS